MLIREDGKYNEQALEELIINVVEEKKPKKVRELASYLKKTYKISTKTTIRLVKQLEKNGKLTLRKKSPLELRTPAQTTLKPQSVLNYLQSPQATDVWIVLALALTAIVAALLIPENLYPVVILRWILGSLFVLFLPGYAITAAVFPKRELDLTEKVAVGFGLSLAISPLVGLILNFTPWGITLTPILICLSLITGLSMLIGVYRKMRVLKEE